MTMPIFRELESEFRNSIKHVCDLRFSSTFVVEKGNHSGLPDCINIRLILQLGKFQ